ncbi:TMV resistance protein N-like protein [Tanacetum coccineum]
MAIVLRSQEAHASSSYSSSSSSISCHPCYSYDVFLSFRGEDTRRSFTDHLYAALTQAGIRTFRDDDEMERGKLLEVELKKAICESAISIIVFSTNYASSKWCLDEVLTIIEENERLSSKHEVVPVFYNIGPSDVRNQTGSFEVFS